MTWRQSGGLVTITNDLGTVRRTMVYDSIFSVDLTDLFNNSDPL
jgi:hypothetical protein